MRYEIADPHLARAISELLAVVLAVDTGPACLDEDDFPPSATQTTGTAT
ncbi:hypothetical protein ACL02T_11900 [Pseudonocardia sp. RS010]